MAKFSFDFSEYKNVWGIYCIRNTVNNKRYIGSAVNLWERITQHQKELNKQIHFNLHLQRSWDKYGEDVFEVEILETVNGIEYNTLLQIEDNYIKLYDSINDKLGYNKRLNFDFPIVSPESIKKRSEKNALRKIKIMLFYAETGEFYKAFNSITECANALHDQTTNISKAKNCITKSVKGFVIISSDTYNPNKSYKKQKPDLTKSDEYIENRRKHNKKNKKVYTYNLDGNLEKIYFSCSEATRQFNLKKDSLSHLIAKYNQVIYNNLIFSYTPVSKDLILEIKSNLWTYEPNIHKNQFYNK